MGEGVGVGLGVGVGGVGSAPLSDITWDKSLGAGAGDVGSLMLGVLVAPLPPLGLGPLALGLGPYVNVLLPLPLLPLPVLGVGTLAEPPPPPPIPEVGPDAELAGVRTAGAMARAFPDAPGLEEEAVGAEAGAVGLPVAGVRGTIDALPGVAPDGVGGTGTSLCKNVLVLNRVFDITTYVLVKSAHDCL